MKLHIRSRKLRGLLLIISIVLGTIVVSVDVQGDTMPKLSGKIVYHTYSSYESRDSKLYLYDFDSKEKVCLSDKFDNVFNTMNANFSSDGLKIVFMGMEKNEGDVKWDIYTYNLQDGSLKNLTKDNDLRNEDPKFSPDNTKVIFKQGHWDHEKDDMIYDLKELDLENESIKTITNDSFEDSMPYYSSDGNTVYYARGCKESSKIYKVNRNDMDDIEEVYSSSNVMAYYPIIYNDTLYFTKWYSKYNHSDIIMKMDIKTGDITKLKFNNKEYNCSDPCPICDRYMIMSSTKDDSGYDLYLADNELGSTWSLSEIDKEINDENEQLGVSCFIKSIE